MPDDVAHVAHAQHNITFLETFYKSYNFNDWSVTVGFYAAVHLIEAAIFITKTFSIKGTSCKLEHSEQLLTKPEIIAGMDINYHQARNLIAAFCFPGIAGWLKTLYNQSRIARYVNYSFVNWKIDSSVLFSLKEIIKWYNQAYSSKVGINL